METETTTEAVQPAEEEITPAEHLRNRADDLGMAAWLCFLVFVAAGVAGGCGLVNGSAWWPLAVSGSAMALTLSLALFLFGHLLHIRAALADRK